jgi:hypothetical protein
MIFIDTPVFTEDLLALMPEQLCGVATVFSRLAGRGRCHQGDGQIT